MEHEFVDWIGYWALRVVAYIVRRLPLETALTLGSWSGRASYFFSGRRRVAYANLKAAFPKSSPHERKRWTQDLFKHLGMMGIEIMRFPTLRKEDIDRYVSFQGYETYLQHRQSRKALILLASHFGNWEFSQIVEGLQGRPMMVLTRRQKYKRLDRLLNSFREHYGSVSVGKGKQIRDLIQELRAGGCVGLLGDQSGGEDGVWVRFFGQLTTAPKGPMAFALKLGATILPAFFIREKGPHHKLVFEPPFKLVRTGEMEKDIQVNTQNYIRLLESYLTRYPSQWLWGHKRWKHTRTKRITILSDGKPGHVKQSEAVVKEIEGLARQKEPPYEISIEKIEVTFRNLWCKRLFGWLAFFFIPRAQGRLGWLRFFFTPECFEKLERTHPDVMVSAGASLVPLNLCLAKENLAKTVTLMKPSFPYPLFRYDVALIPAHDRGILPRGHLSTQGALSSFDPETLEASKELLARSLPNPEKVKLGLFLGGETRSFKPSVSDIETLLNEVERISEKLGGDFLMTTSRRTSPAVSDFLKKRFSHPSRCQLCVIASEDQRSEVVPGIMALADFLLVTEDSLSMISESLRSGKPVAVVKMARNGLPKKHDRFQKILHKTWGVPVIETHRLSEILTQGELRGKREPFEGERQKILEKLETLF